MDPRAGYQPHPTLDNNGGHYHVQHGSGGPGYAQTSYMGHEYALDSHHASPSMGYQGQHHYQQPMQQFSEAPPYDPRLEPQPNYRTLEPVAGNFSHAHPYPTESHHDKHDSRSSALDHRSRGHSQDRFDRSDRFGSKSASYPPSRGRRDERSDRFRSEERNDYPDSRRKGGRGPPPSSAPPSSSSSRQGDHPASRSHSDLEPRGKKKKPAALTYALCLRSYNITQLTLNTVDLKRLHPDYLAPLDMTGIKIHWPLSIPFSPSMDASPPIPINFSIPMSINNEIVPPTWSIRPASKLEFGSQRIQVRVLLIRGSPIDISAPKSGSVHSNNNIMFLLLERGRDGRPTNLCAPGGLFDPQLDCNSDPRIQEPVDQPFIRTAIRTVKEQLALDLSKCSKWFRFMDIEYARDGTTADDRVLYFIPSVWEALPSEEAFPELWKEHRKYELQSTTLMNIERLKNRLADTEYGSPQYGQIKGELTQKEDETKYFTDPPINEAPPEKPMLLIRVNPSATNGQRASNYTLQNLLLLDVKRDSTPEDMSEVFLFAHRFDEYLQYYFGSCILLHVAMMRDHVLRGQRQLVFHGTPIITAPTPLNPKKRSRDEQESSISGHPREQKPLDALEEPKVKREIKHELSDDTPDISPASSHYMPKHEPVLHHQSAPTSATGQLSQNTQLPHSQPTYGYKEPTDPRLASAAPVETREPGVPADYSRSRPPKLPEHRNYRLMQAFRYFDLNRLGYLQGEDLIHIFLTLGLGINRKIATELSAAADTSLPHYPFIHSGFSNDKHVRYKPICDWLHSMGLELPASQF